MMSYRPNNTVKLCVALALALFVFSSQSVCAQSYDQPNTIHNRVQNNSWDKKFVHDDEPKLPKKQSKPNNLKQIEKMAKSGNVEAMMHMGQLALNDNNIKKAREWYEKASKAGNKEAKEMLELIDKENPAPADPKK